MQKFDILSRKLNVFGSHFLEASAGTGKTFAIEHLVARLLIEGDNPLRIDQILVVTFTRAATRELKQRIRATLVRTADALGGQPEIEYLQAICEQGDAAIYQAKERIAEALVCFDRAQIFTVHGFCHRMLSDLAFEAKIGFDPVGPDEGAHRAVIEETIYQFLRTGLTLPEYSSMQIHGVLKKHLWKMDRFVKAIVRLLNRNKPMRRSLSFAQVHEKIQQALSSLEEIGFEEWLEDFQALRSCYKEMRSSAMQEQAAVLGRWLSLRSCSLEELDQLLTDEELFLEKMEPGNLMKRAKFPEPAELHYPDLIPYLRSELLPWLRMAKDRGLLLLRIAHDCQNACQRALCRTEMFSPDGILEKMQEALRSPSFAAKIREQYRAAIVDEFQDTDPLQWEIFQKLFLNHADVLCLVGDPKQSIYAFRNADVYTYLSAASALGEKSRAYLDTNFRSSAPLVGALNRLFATEDGKGWMRLPAQGISLTVPAVKSRHGENGASEGSRGSIHFFLAEGAASVYTRKWPHESLFQDSYFPFIAQEIHALRAERKIAWEEIVILVSDRYQARRVFQFLKEQQIPACVKRGGALTDSPAYDALKELMEAVLSPTDLGAFKRLLAGPLVGWTAQRVQGNRAQEALVTAKGDLLELHEILSQQGFACFFQAFLRTFHVDRTLLQAKELSFYSELRQLAEIIIEHELSDKLSKQGILRFLEELKRLDPEEEQWLKIRASEEIGSVAIMTTHLSKGLEFDTVFALGSIVRQGPKEQIVLAENGAAHIGLLDLEDPACLAAVEEADAEKLRQYYVALTRAKTRVYVPLALNTGAQTGLKLGQASACELFCAQLLFPEASYVQRYEQIRSLSREQVCSLLTQMGLEASITYSVIESQSPLPKPVDAQSEILLTPPPPFTPPGKPDVFRSFTSLANKRETEVRAPAQELSLFPTPHTLPLGAETGIVFHRLVELALRAELHFPLQAEKIAHLVFKELKGHALEEWKDLLVQMIISALQTPLAGFSLSEIPAEHMLQEMEFVFPMTDGMMKGFADLVFEHGGKYYLLDWKTNFLGPSDRDYRQESLMSSMKAHDYELQASIYTEALRRYVKLFDTRPFEQCFGGAFYFFVRGNGVLHLIPKEFAC